MLYTSKNALMITTADKNNNVVITLIDDYKIALRAVVSRNKLIDEIENAMVDWYPSKSLIENNKLQFSALFNIKDTDYIHLTFLAQIYEKLSENKPYESSKDICLFEATGENSKMYLDVFPPESSEIEKIRFELDNELDWNYTPSSNQLIHKDGTHTFSWIMLFDETAGCINIFSGRSVLERAKKILNIKTGYEWYDLLNTYLKISKKLLEQSMKK